MDSPVGEQNGRALKTSFKVLGVRVDAVQIPGVIDQMVEWIESARAYHCIAVSNMHVVNEAQRDPSLKQALNSADLVVPDGMPLVLLGRSAGFPLPRRVYGPELLAEFCKRTGSSYRHFFYGAAPGVAERLGLVLSERYGIQVAGAFSPPFRPLSSGEQEQIADLINDAKPDVVWVGIGAPKQEAWMADHRERLSVPVAVGVGAAFDFLTGTKRMAPAWVGNSGLEWLFRLLTEPRRLWRRYLLGGIRFTYMLALERLHLRRFG